MHLKPRDSLLRPTIGTCDGWEPPGWIVAGTRSGNDSPRTAQRTRLQKARVLLSCAVGSPASMEPPSPAHEAPEEAESRPSFAPPLLPLPWLSPCPPPPACGKRPHYFGSSGWPEDPRSSTPSRTPDPAVRVAGPELRIAGALSLAASATGAAGAGKPSAT